MANFTTRAGVVHVEGDVDIDTAHHLMAVGREALEQCSGSAIVIDLSSCSFMDSSGLGALVGVRTLAHDAGVTMLLRGVPGRIDRVLELTGLRDYFPVAASESVAVHTPAWNRTDSREPQL